MIAALRHGFLDWRLALAPAALTAVISLTLGLGLVGARLPAGLGLRLLFWTLFGAGYGFGAVTYADVRFDQAPGQVYPAQVQRVYVSHGRSSSTPHLVLGPWGPRAGVTDIAVSYAAYNALPPGQTACVTLHPGRLSMAWYEAGVCGEN